MAGRITVSPRISAVEHTNAPLFDGLYQMGFVTSDLVPAQNRLGQRFGVSRWREKRDSDRILTAHAYAGDMMIEIIEPGSNAPALYLEAVPGGGAVRLHHLGYRVRDVAAWDCLLQLVEREGWDTPLRGAVMDGHLRYLYVDTLADLGIYQEYVCMTGPALHLYDDVPAN